MNRITLLFTSFLCVVSCSWIDSKTKEDIEKKAHEAISAIEIAGEDQVKKTQTRIEEEIAISVRKASDNIDTLVKASLSQIEQATNQKVQLAINKEVDKLKEYISVAVWMALVGFFVAIIGLSCGIIALLKLRGVKLKDSVVDYVTHSERINMFLRSFIDDEKPQSKTSSITQADVRTIVKQFLSDPKILESIAKQIDIPSTVSPNMSTPVQYIEIPSVNAEPQVVRRFELYARDSNTKVLSDIFTSHQKGKTIYKLIMETPNSTSALLDLCLEADAVGRVLRFNDEDLEPICSVSRNSDKPESVRVLKRGRAEKIGTSEWNVTESIEIELN